MKLKSNLNIRTIGDENIVMGGGGETVDCTRVISLNATAAYLLKETENAEFTSGEWAELLVKKYGIEMERAAADVEKLIENLKAAGLIQE